MEIQTSTGRRDIIIRHFPAFEGYEIQHRFLEFAAATDSAMRRAYLMDVLAYASVSLNGAEPIPLTTAALVDNHLESWQNISKVFEEILRLNGIDPEEHANKPRFWAQAGEQMAIAFLAQCTTMIGPAMEAASKLNSEQGQAG